MTDNQPAQELAEKLAELLDKAANAPRGLRLRTLNRGIVDILNALRAQQPVTNPKE